MIRGAVILLALICGFGLQPVQAGEPEPFQDFTFKRVAVPKAGAGKPAVGRITVQIDPDAPRYRMPDRVNKQEPTVASLEPGPDKAMPAVPLLPKPAAYDWYWALVSPALDKSGPGRLRDAVLKLADAPPEAPVPAPRLQHLQDIAEAHGVEILTATVGTRVSPALVIALIGVESSGKTDALSHAGAQGLMQLMPDTATRFGVKDSTIAAQNIRGGVAYLDWLLGEFDGDPVMALAGYNAGENAVKSNGGVPPYAETRAYVPKVLAAWQVARGLCVTPPELVSDGCVFAVAGNKTNG